MKNIVLPFPLHLTRPPLSAIQLPSNFHFAIPYSVPPFSQNINSDPPDLQHCQGMHVVLPHFLGQNIYPIPKFSISEIPQNYWQTSNHDQSSSESLLPQDRIKQEIKHEDCPVHSPDIIKKEEPTESSQNQQSFCKIEEDHGLKLEIKEDKTEPKFSSHRKTRSQAGTLVVEQEKLKDIGYRRCTQNRIKNLPGLIIQRVRSSIKMYLNLKTPIQNVASRIQYAEKFLKDMNRMEKDGFLSYLEQYEKRWKTWNSILAFLKRDQKYGLIILDVIAEFLSESGKEDFDEWLRSGKMCEKSKATIIEMKDKLAYKYSQIFINPAVLQESFTGNRLYKKQKIEKLPEPEP